MLGEMTWRQFQEWMVYADLEPFDEERMDQRVGALIAAVYNVNRRRGTPPFKPDECAPVFGDGEVAKRKLAPAKPWQQLKAFAYAMVGIFGSADGKGDKA